LNEGVLPYGYRIGFIPLFLICNVLPEGRVLTSVLLESDIAYILIMAAFSLTNGYLGSLCMINAPQVIRLVFF
jgi:equilibrative nucleoside transporter 1/2/3